jgi:hypothetical protein
MILHQTCKFASAITAVISESFECIVHITFQWSTQCSEHAEKQPPSMPVIYMDRQEMTRRIFDSNCTA